MVIDTEHESLENSYVSTGDGTVVTSSAIPKRSISHHPEAVCFLSLIDHRPFVLFESSVCIILRSQRSVSVKLIKSEASPIFLNQWLSSEAIGQLANIQSTPFSFFTLAQITRAHSA
jgi:hypothetical protein